MSVEEGPERSRRTPIPAALSGGVSLARTGTRFAKTLLRVTDGRRWRRLPVTLHADTRTRAQALAGLIPAGSSVLDLGAGPQHLRLYLPADCHYQPCDIAAGPDVLICDLNRGLPAVDRRFDVVVCAGVIEYLRDLRGFLRGLPGLGDVFLITYVARNADDEAGRLSGRLQRVADGFMVHHTYAELESIFTELGFRWEVVGRWSGAGRGYRLVARHDSTEA